MAWKEAGGTALEPNRRHGYRRLAEPPLPNPPKDLSALASQDAAILLLKRMYGRSAQKLLAAAQAGAAVGSMLRNVRDFHAKVASFSAAIAPERETVQATSTFDFEYPFGFKYSSTADALASVLQAFKGSINAARDCLDHADEMTALAARLEKVGGMRFAADPQRNPKLLFAGAFAIVAARAGSFYYAPEPDCYFEHAVLAVASGVGSPKDATQRALRNYLDKWRKAAPVVADLAQLLRPTPKVQ